MKKGETTLSGEVLGQLPESKKIDWKGALGTRINVPVGIWNITFKPDENLSGQIKNLPLEFSKIRISRDAESSIIHNLMSPEIHFTPIIYSQNVSWGDNAYLQIYVPGKKRADQAMAVIRSGETMTLKPGTFDLEYFYDSGVPLRLNRYITGFSTRPGTDYKLSLDLDVPLIKVVIKPSDVSDVASGSVKFLIGGSLEKEIPFNQPIYVQSGQYDLVFTWKSQYGITWSLTQSAVNFDQAPGSESIIRFDVNDQRRVKV